MWDTSCSFECNDSLSANRPKGYVNFSALFGKLLGRTRAPTRTHANPSLVI